MKNYSDIKTKPQLSSIKYSNIDVSIAPSIAKAGTKPLIQPASATPALPKIKSKPPAIKSTVSHHPFDWDNILNRTFLSLFLQKDDPLMRAGKYDYVFYIGSQRIYTVVHHESMDVNSLKLSQKRITTLKQRAATKLSKRVQQLRQKLALPQVGEDNITSVYCLGLTSISIYFKGQEYPIEHDYSSQFFQEECVLDLDDDSQVLQLFSLGGLVNIIKLLQTPSDLLTFLDYHRPILVNQLPYSNEVTLAQKFLTSPNFFERAIEVQKQLVDIGLLANIEDRLINANKTQQNPMLLNEKDEVTDNQTQQTELIQKLQNYAKMYQKLINGLAKRQHELGKTLPIYQVQLLINESMYTRMSIIEEVVAYADRSEEECYNGYLCHQHSYNNFGHHYVLIVYGLDEDAQYSRESVRNNHENLLMDINSQLQKPVMKQYFIIGFDMSKHDGEGNITVEIDAYHQAGSTMTLLEKRLYDRVQALSPL